MSNFLVGQNLIYCWEEFQNWADANGVSLEHEDDWKPWWECWRAAIDAKKQQEGPA